LNVLISYTMNCNSISLYAFMNLGKIFLLFGLSLYFSKEYLLFNVMEEGGVNFPIITSI